MYQLLMSPLMAPERITNSNTKMLTAVKTLFTIADSLTPNARIPGEETDRTYKLVMNTMEPCSKKDTEYALRNA